MGEYVGQSIFHTLVGALVIEALLRLWKIDEPAQRLTFRALCAAIPVLLVPALALLAPGRSAPAFQEHLALFAGPRWAEIRFAGIGLGWVWLAAMSALGAGLLLLDLVPLAKDLRSERARRRAGGPLTSDAPAAAPVERVVLDLAARLGMRSPRVVVTPEEAPRLFCRGIGRGQLLISKGALALLDPAELRAALAHELGHLWRRDPLLGWALGLARLLLFFNPVFHLVARRIVHEAEWRADDFAGAATGDRLALASGFLKVARAAGGGGRGTLIGAPMSRARSLAVEARCRRLMAPLPPAAVPLGRLRLALTASSLLTLLFFVV